VHEVQRDTEQPFVQQQKYRNHSGGFCLQDGHKFKSQGSFVQGLG
jgi:hypothetical protein